MQIVPSHEPLTIKLPSGLITTLSIFAACPLCKTILTRSPSGAGATELPGAFPCASPRFPENTSVMQISIDSRITKFLMLRSIQLLLHHISGRDKDYWYRKDALRHSRDILGAFMRHGNYKTMTLTHPRLLSTELGASQRAFLYSPQPPARPSLLAERGSSSWIHFPKPPPLYS